MSGSTLIGLLIALAKKLQATMTQTVTAWLNEHVDPDTGYVIDDSMTVENAAADAKAVGDALYNMIHIDNNGNFYVNT